MDAKTPHISQELYSTVLTAGKKKMCERHSQAPPMLASPSVETTERGRSGLLRTGFHLPSSQRYPEPHVKGGKELLCDAA